MRTTFTLDDDVAAAVERIRREEGAGLSQVVNRLIRRSLSQSIPRTQYEHESADVGLRVDVSDIGAVLDLLDDV